MTEKFYVKSCSNVMSDSMSISLKTTEPIIVPASRSTDIPAFYGDWLVNRLHADYCVWYNPFNRKPFYVSFSKTRAFVFWSKNPSPFLRYLVEFDKKNIGYYFQFTLNDYVRENLEPNVGSLETRIETFQRLSAQIGRERVIWRFDPIIIGPNLSPSDIIERIRYIGKKLYGYTEKLVFSFVDVAAYRKVQINMSKTGLFKKDNVFSAEATDEQIKVICEKLASLRDEWANSGWNIALSTCAEKKCLENYGIEHNRCIDDVLLRRLYPNDDKLVGYLSSNQYSLPSLTNKRLKDSGQRKECGCIVSKDIGMYNTCLHFCAYCYANNSVKSVKENHASYSKYHDSIIKI